MSAFGGKADVRELPSVCLLIAISGHTGFNATGGVIEPDLDRGSGEDSAKGGSRLQSVDEPMGERSTDLSEQLG